MKILDCLLKAFRDFIHFCKCKCRCACLFSDDEDDELETPKNKTD